MSTDRETFLALLDRHGARVLGMLRRLCGNSHDAEDVFQDVAIRVWKHLGERPRLRDDGAWLMTVAYRAYLDSRSRRPMSVLSADDDEGPAWTAPDNDPLAALERAERVQLVDRTVATLSAPLREVVVLHYTAGLSLREVAEAMGLSVGTVKSRLNAGLEQLRRRLS